MDLFRKLQQKAQADPKRIILPEGSNERVLRAASFLSRQHIAKVTLLGKRKDVLSKARKLGLEGCEEIEIIHPVENGHIEKLAATYYKLRKHKGITKEQAREKLQDPVYFAALMVRENLADGFVAGAGITSKEIAKAAIRGVGVDSRVQTVSSSFLMVVPNCSHGERGIFMFADCGIIPNPSAKQIANIAVCTADLFEQLVGVQAKVAMLSYSSHGSGSGEDVEKVKQAVKSVNRLSPELIVDGELQADAAIIPHVAKIKTPHSKLAGCANVLIFPNLAAGNISYKLVHRLASARAVGPILQGLIKPCSDLSRGCDVQDIIDAVIVNVVRAQ